MTLTRTPVPRGNFREHYAPAPHPMHPPLYQRIINWLAVVAVVVVWLTL